MDEQGLAERTVDGTDIPLHPLARNALVEAVKLAFVEVERTTLQVAAEYLRRAMDDVEKQPATDCNRHLMFDVRRLADEIEAFAEEDDSVS